VNDASERPPGFAYRGKKQEFYCEQVALDRLAERFGTPLYVYSAGTIRERLRAFENAFRNIDHTVCYSVKANSNLSILRLLKTLGCGFDVVSGGELERALRVSRGVAGKTVFSGVGKTTHEMQAALRAGLLLFNLESASELDALASCASQVKRHARIAFRVNPDVPAETHPYISTGLHRHKFGIPIGEARELYARAAKARHLQVAGVSVHIGSQITDAAPFAAAMERVADLVRQLRADRHSIEYVDAGGGLGISYLGQDDFRVPVTAYAKAITAPLRKLKVKLLLEPGRSIVGPAGLLLTRVLYRKGNNDKKFVVVDAAMNDLIRPSLYQTEHQIVPVHSPHRETQTVDIVGPICESGDFFARGRQLADVEEGELLAILDAGAYGMVLASNYNTRPRPAEVLVQGKSAKLVRKRERISDLLRLET
jgi:diaminopimelate decarboxylase